MNIENIALACAKECVRQHVGLDRIAMLINAYKTAQDFSQTMIPDEFNIRQLALIIEPHINRFGYRTGPAVFATGVIAMDAYDIKPTMTQLCEYLDDDTYNLTPDEFTKQFLSIHPFQDGNGRVAFLLYNWLNKSLDDPKTLPNYFGEKY